VHEILQSLGVTEALLRNWIFVRGCEIAPDDLLQLSGSPIRVDMPLFGAAQAPSHLLDRPAWKATV
jgi:hypothetical protein